MATRMFSAILFAGLIISGPIRGEDTLDVLLKNYKAFGLPIPPESAKLVRIDTGWRTGDKGEQHIYVLGFLLNPGAEKEQLQFQVGTIRVSEVRGYKQIEDIPPSADIVSEIRSEWSSTALGGLNVGLATAIQCKARGWNDVAQALLDKSLNSYAGHHFSLFYQRANLPPETALATVAFAHYGDQLSEPDSNWQEIYDHLNAIIASEPTLDTERHKGFMENLKLSLRPSQAKPGTVEALVDSLVTDPKANSRMHNRDERLSVYDKLEDMGFEAVPTLIEHLDDLRLTPYLKQGFNNFPTYHMNVGALASELLQSISGKDLGKDWLRRQQGWNVEKADVEAWWAEAKKHEEEYLVKNALPEDAKIEWPNAGVLRALSKKYPERLMEIYRTILDKRPNMQSHPVVTAIAESALPREKKIEILAYAGQNKNLEHRRAAFWELKNLDHPRFVEMLVATLKIIPPTPEGEYWSCREGAFLQLVMQTKDVRAWQAMLEAAKRADVGLRMEMITPTSEAPESQQRLLLTYLSNFLSDETVRDINIHSEKYEGPIAGDGFPLLSIRNQAATSLSRRLKLDIKPLPEWTEEQWTEFRGRVKDALEKEKIGTAFSE